MARGSAAEVGATRTAPNGYHYTKTEDRGWMLTHHLTAEKMLGRRLRDNESVRFVSPKYKREPYNEKGLRIVIKKTGSLRRRLAQLEARRDEIDAQINELKAELEATI